MADLGLTKAIKAAVKQGGKGAKVLRPEEVQLRNEIGTGLPKVSGPEPVATPTIEPAVDATPLPRVEGEPQPIAATPELPTEAATTAEAERLTKVQLGDFDLDKSFQPNFDTMTTTDDIKAVIADTSQKYAGKIDEARRGVITNQQLQALADDLDVDGTTVQTIMNRETGGAVNAETVLAARQMLNSSADRISTLAKKITAGQANDIDRIMFRRQIQFHADFQTQFMGARAEAGRALNAFSIPTNVNAAQLARMKETVERMTGDTDQLAKVLSEVDSTGGVTKLTRKYTQSKLWGTTGELFVNSILSGPKTALVNLAGNALFQTMNIAETAIASRIGRFLGGEEHVLVGEASAQLHGTLAGVRDGLRLAAKAFKSGRTLDDMVKYDTGPMRSITAQNLLPPGMQGTPLARFVDAVGTAVRLPTERVIAPTDEFFKTLAYRAEVERQAFVHASDQVASNSATVADAAKIARDFMENTPVKAQEAAGEYAKYVTFQNQLGEKGRKFEAAIRSVPALTLLAPFIRTPINIFKAGLLDRSPVALFTRKFHEDIRAGGRRRDMALARVTMGSMTSAWIAYETVQGNITGGGPQNDEARQLLMAQGWQPYSVRWTDPTTGDVKYTSYARFEPLAFVIGATADTTEILSYINADVETMQDEDAKVYEAAAAIIAGVANNTMSKTFMKGLADFSELLSDPKRYSQQWGGQMITAMTPYSSFRRQINQIQDPYMREAWTITDKLKTQSGIPGYSAEAPPRRDLFGEPRKYAAGDLVGSMSPMPSSTAKDSDPVIRELNDVMRETRQVPITMPGKSIEGMRLLASEYDDLVRLSRQSPLIRNRTFKQELDRTMNSRTYLRSTPAMRAELLRDVQERYDSLARIQLEKINPDYAYRKAVYDSKKQRLRFDQ